MEIERKLLLAAPPAASLLADGVPIAQGYLGSGLRLRRMGTRAYLNLKAGAGVVREEWESEVPLWVFELLWPGTAGRRLEKTRYFVPDGEGRLEIDGYHGPLAGLWTLEREFASRAEAERWTPPAWAASARDVTLDPAYTNSSLAARGLPAR